eukprot:CAMPEP_0177640794 /NCGR_PEP_ID=MMETSP0447-20121125/6728_1 /TAXON_ID=0 /ORGANISM="Stygamoeba regulata, Strain BSH-02190019" /LENGTH=232 /DNA_ID=CAMNT_0019142879 /DNA_START=452 /DNA_END=1150 /DNA_ORIENTATION=-
MSADRNGQVSWEDGMNRIFCFDLTLLSSSVRTGSTYLTDVGDVWGNPHMQVKTERKIPRTDATAVVVAGKRLLQGGKPSQVLLSRLQTASVLFCSYANTPGNIIVVSGGCVEKDDDEEKFYTESSVMKELLIGYGIPSDRIVEDELSVNTIETALNVRDILDDHGIQRLIALTSAFHLPRLQTIFGKIFDDHYSVKFVEDHPALCQQEAMREERTEAYMLSVLDDHLKYYIY